MLKITSVVREHTLKSVQYELRTVYRKEGLQPLGILTVEHRNGNTNCGSLHCVKEAKRAAMATFNGLEAESGSDYVLCDRADSGSKGRPVQVVTANPEEHNFLLNEDALTGAFRRGKSFMLNFFLKYLQSEGVGWLNDDSTNLDGFSWRGGAERDTSGVLLWSHPFLLKRSNGDEVAVLLMDTQGSFDSQSTVKDCATIFALATMVSSVQIYNLSQNIQEDDLQHLQLFTEYGRLALEDNVTPFQSLIFLVRDWSYPYEAEYGFKGGARILRRRLEISKLQHPELQQLREHISSCFTEITCFLMPHPGLKVATSPNFYGQMSDIEPDFKRQLLHFVPQILASNNLVLKKINGREICCRELLEYFRAYMKVFAGEDLPEPKSMLMATAEANNLAAVANARALYCNEMEEVCGGDTPYLAPDDLQDQHMEKKNKSIMMFKNVRKMGGEEYSLTFLNTLEADLNACYENYVKLNSGKNVFRSFRTPAVLFLVVLLNYTLQQLFLLVGLNLLSSLCSNILGLLMVTIALWFYIRYTGDMRDVGQTIDAFSEMIWLEVLRPASQFAITESAKHASVYVSSNLTVSESANSFGTRKISRPRRTCRK
uniref:GB1/RHD3-type G domain-containing protein n=1 Tax=Trichuris muris TaxID=70415 RepID=A0A5S6R139_TRIMR